MLPSVPLVVTSSKDSPNISVVEDKVKCESTSRAQPKSAKIAVTKVNAQLKSASQSSVGQTDRIDERQLDKSLRPIAPKPVTKKTPKPVCKPDLSSARETEKEVTEKQEVKPKSTGDINVKTTGAGSAIKCEKENEEEASGCKKNSSTGRSPPKPAKKKPKQIRDLEKTLNCLLSDNEQVKDEKAFAFAQAYFLKVTETLHGKDDVTYSEFMKTMNDFGVTIFDATDLYQKVTQIFQKYPSLSEEFIAFLLPEQAMQCGKFMEYIMITKMRSFCRKLELYYSKQPIQLQKIYSSLATLASNNKATLDDLKNTILPLIRNNSLLVNMFLELMPTEAPHASSLTDYESMDFSNVRIQNPKPEDWFETVEVPPPVEDNMYGGDDCICPCHVPPEGMARRQFGHCMSCGTKFIQGRVYIHSGSMLRPARLSFKEMRTKTLERLSVKNLKTRRKIDKNQGPSSGNKKNNSTKGEITSTNVSAVSNKLSAPKTTKRATKGKTLNENQKKSSKTVSSKASHNKQLSNDKKITKPPRKRIKLTNNTEKPTSAKVLVSSKKGVSQAGKMPCKVDAKTSSKTVPQISSQHSEISLRAARSAARNMTFSNNCNQKSNRRQSGNTSKGEPFITSATDIPSKKPKEEYLKKNKNTSSLSMSSTNVVSKREGASSDVSLENRKMVVDPEESLLEENVCTAALKASELTNDQTLKSSALSDDVPSVVEGQCISHVSSIVKEENGSSHNLHSGSEKEEKEALKKNVDSVVCSEEASCDLDRKNSASKDANRQIKSSGHGPSTSNDSSTNRSLDMSMQEDIIDSFSQCKETNTQIQGENSKIEIIEFENSIENISSEDEKHVIDPEDFSRNSSESEIEDNYQMDIDDVSKETDDLSRSSQNDVSESNEHAEGNHSSSITSKTDRERPDSTPWTRDEDKIILRTFQCVNNSDHVFQKICHELPSRTAEEVRSRFQTLMSFLQKMTGDQTSS